MQLTHPKLATTNKAEVSVKSLDQVSEAPEDGAIAGGVKLTGADSDGGEQLSSPACKWILSHSRSNFG